MRKHLFWIVIFLSLSACFPGFKRDSQAANFEPPDPNMYVKLSPVVQEYFYHRKNAVLTGDVTAFWRQYPALSESIDHEKGINREKFEIEALKSLKPFDGNIFPEYYEPFQVQIDEDQELQILLHGMALYVWQDSDGAFNESGGEFKLILYLKPLNDSWQIYKTDEVMLSEWKDFNP